MDLKVHIRCPHCGSINRLTKDKLSKHPLCGRCHKRLFIGKPIELTSNSFNKEITKTQIPIVVDFWAPWCGPCKRMTPIFEQAAASVEPRARLAKLNAESAQEIAAQFNIRSIPTIVIFRHGKEVTRQSGTMDLARLMQTIQSYL